MTNQKIDRLQIKVSPSERDTIQSAASESGETLSSFIRRVVLQFIRRENGTKPKREREN